MELPLGNAVAGTHKLTFKPNDPGIVLEKIVIDFGGYTRQYLHGEESPREQATGATTDRAVCARETPAFAKQNNRNQNKKTSYQPPHTFSLPPWRDGEWAKN